MVLVVMLQHILEFLGDIPGLLGLIDGIERQELEVSTALEIRDAPSVQSAIPADESLSGLWTGYLPFIPERGSFPPELLVVFRWTFAVNNFTAVGSELGKVVGARIASLSDNTRFTPALPSVLVTGVGQGPQSVAIAGEANVPVVHLLNEVELLAGAFAVQSVAGFIETIEAVAVAGAADGFAPPVPGTDLALLSLAVRLLTRGGFAGTFVLAVADILASARRLAEVE